MFREERCESLLERECPVEQNIAVAVIVSVRHESSVDSETVMVT